MSRPLGLEKMGQSGSSLVSSYPVRYFI
jgi:hypothetical protein